MTESKQIDPFREERLKQVKDLDEFIASKYRRFRVVLDKLGWSEESLQTAKKIQCPLNAGHWVAESTLDRHLKTCSSSDDPYLKEDLEQVPPSTHFCYKNSTSTVPVLFDKEELTRILAKSNGSEAALGTQVPMKIIEKMPRTMDRYIADFSSRERVAVYDHIIEKSRATNKPATVTVDDLVYDFDSKPQGAEGDLPKSKLELLAEQRDYKRRRQSYRAKNVHLTKKSYTEVIREVIENQTNFLADVVKQETQEELDRTRKNNVVSDDKHHSEEPRSRRDNDDDECHSSRRRHRSRERSRDRHHRKHKRSRSRSRSRKKHKKHKR